MYIGSTDVRGLHHLVWEVVDNSIDEAMAGYATRSTSRSKTDGTVTVQDDGRGVPVGQALDRQGRPRGRPHRPPRRRQVRRRRLQGLRRPPRRRRERRQRPVRVAARRDRPATATSGRRSTSAASRTARSRRSARRASRRARRRASGPTPRCSRRPTTRSTRSASACASRPTSPRASGSRSSTSATTASARSTSRAASVRSSGTSTGTRRPSTAGRSTSSAGRARPPSRSRSSTTTRTPRTCSRSPTTSTPSTAAPTSRASARALTSSLNDWARRAGVLKDADGNLSGDDVREGLTAVISVKLTDPQFEGQTKAKLGNAEVEGQVQTARRRQPRPVPRGEPGRRPPDHREVPHGGARPRGRPQGARPRHPQGRARRHVAARQARRLPGARSGPERALHRRGRLGRRLGQAGPRPAVPGDPAAARQAPQRREGAARQDPLEPRTSSR